jgi:hypothetical protein
LKAAIFAVVGFTELLAFHLFVGFSFCRRVFSLVVVKLFLGPFSLVLVGVLA